MPMKLKDRRTWAQEVIKYARSSQLAHDERESLLRAIASRDPERIKAARQKLRARSRILNNRIQKMSKESFLTFGEFVAEEYSDDE